MRKRERRRSKRRGEEVKEEENEGVIRRMGETYEENKRIRMRNKEKRR